MDSLFIQACKGLKTSRIPIWLNRQAGRYMEEYHQIKGGRSSLEFFKASEPAAEVTLMAQRKLGVDAAILFTDLLPILEPMGMQLDYIPNRGPVFANPLRDEKAISTLCTDSIEDSMSYIGKTIELILPELPASVPLIGFVGAPFTLAAYAVEGEGSKQYQYLKTLMYGNEPLWQQLMEKLLEVLCKYVDLQMNSGVHALQIFDSWVGCLSEESYKRYVFPWTQRLISHAKRYGRPIIYFGTGNTHLLPAMYATSPDVLALDWRASVVQVWDALRCKAVQGNLDPTLLFASPDIICEHVTQLLQEINGRSGYIFNLGHGILPKTPVSNVQYLVECVQGYSCA